MGKGPNSGQNSKKGMAPSQQIFLCGYAEETMKKSVPCGRSYSLCSGFLGFSLKQSRKQFSVRKAFLWGKKGLSLEVGSRVHFLDSLEKKKLFSLQEWVLSCTKVKAFFCL